jgi:chromosome segregation ATPase
MRTLATNWEAEVASVRGENRGLRSLLEGAQAQQRQAEERARGLEQRAKEAGDLKAALDAKVAALVVAEEQLQQERTARQGAERRLQQEQAALVDARSTLEQERVAREAAQKSLEERNTAFSKAEGELIVLSITNANNELASKSKVRPSSASSWRSRPCAATSRQRGSKSKVSCCLTLVWLVFRLGTRTPFF